MTKNDKIINEMKKEDRIRQEIKDIFESLNRPEERVLDVHGSDEYGLDLVILRLDIFHQLRAYGIQIKSGDIKCSGKANKKVKEIIGQIMIAFGKEFQIDGKKYKLDGFYIVTDGKFKGKAMEYINSASVGIRNLHFIGGDSLNELRTIYPNLKKQLYQT